jgi:hypothetical protein
MKYDVAKTRRRMNAAGLKAGYAEAVLSGLWPIEEVLLSKEKSRRGKPLVLRSLLI